MSIIISIYYFFLSLSLAETVFITRTYEEPLPFIRLYVGGVDDGGTSTPFLKGCIRGMRMGDIQIELAHGIEGRDNITGDP